MAVRVLRLCREANAARPCRGRDWYATCLDRIAELEEHAEAQRDLLSALAPWRELCAAIGDGLNEACDEAAADDEAGAVDAETDALDIDYANAGPIAKWLLRRLNGRLG